MSESLVSKQKSIYIIKQRLVARQDSSPELALVNQIKKSKTMTLKSTTVCMYVCVVCVLYVCVCVCGGGGDGRDII